MDEEECDYRSPIGKVIKHINCLSKKAPIDHQLSEAIDLFHVKLEEQEKYLANGIFRINFAESALFLQSCAELYGKKIDVLWNDLLEFHTRLIKYDCEDQKQKGAPLNEEAIAKLEERRNRYLRKKKFKLMIEENQEVVNSNPSHDLNPAPEKLIDVEYLIFENGELLENDEDDIADLSVERDERANELWEKVAKKAREYLRVPTIVYKQMTREYRLKNYPIMKSVDFDVLDLEDGEFNTKYSRVPGWHHIMHLIEYNNDGLLPDENNIIARLKLAMEGKFEFFRSHKIPFEMPFEQYKQDYFKFSDEFIKHETNRWQNMPLNTFADFRRQLEFLAQMHEKNEQMHKRAIKTKNLEASSDDVLILDSSDADSVLELSSRSNNDSTQPDLRVRLEKLSSDVMGSKLRQDSGVYDCNSGSENETSAATAEAEGGGEAAARMETIAESEGGVDENVPNDALSTNASDTIKDKTDGSGDAGHASVDSEKSVTVDVNSNITVGGETDCTATDDADDGDDFDTRSCISDHDYCLSPPLIPPIETKRGRRRKVLESTNEEVFKKPLGPAKTVTNVKSQEVGKKRQVTGDECDSAGFLIKRRKLSEKQIALLLRSKIAPVKCLKFEKFFSENYQPEDGEGSVLSVDYESDPEPDAENEDENADAPPDDNAYLSDDDDTRSVFSDHSYSMRQTEEPHRDPSPNDSGFLEGSVQLSQQSNASDESREKEHESIAEKELSATEKEYQRVLALLRADQEEDGISEEEALRQMALKEKEWKESQDRVREWRDTITPILKNLKERDFDIHEYGSRIIEGMQVNESKAFGDLVQNKPSAEVVRYFISSLQLANTRNIEIRGAQQGKLSNDTFEIKLLSKDRYHEHLNEYQAPSEETLGERMKRARAMSAQQNNYMVNAKKFKSEEKMPKYKKSPQYSEKKKMVVNITRVSQAAPITEIRSTYQCDKENFSSLAAVTPDFTAKGPHILNYDFSLPCTSRRFTQSEVPAQTAELASTSAPNNFNSTQNHSPKAHSATLNKRRRSDSSEESFMERLASIQRGNPDIQVHSTPQGPSPAKHMRVISVSKKSIVF
ncbi:hypothetical protein NQ315_016929 [Exocentrus adspersus]|uniref:Condensin-2 complex subunit H2 C-terminal domain-containing protein n=1 Tax=Exocentrus adspersus TaxID=1586481 RepID=A0AAV8VXT7_9CUCU|nr:hypothetical protein NQ315_016929 [Exocentrus adspersus]